MPTNNPDYIKQYQNNRNARRRLQALEKLGGKCCGCGSVEELEVDHIDPATKSFGISGCCNKSQEKFEAELTKCQLLCKPCHVTKSIADRGDKVAVGTHGTISAYRYCKCHLCKDAKSLTNRKSNAARDRRKVK